MTFTAKYGVVGLSVVQKEFIAEGINEAGLSAGLFFFPQYGGYEPYEPAQNDRTLADLQFVTWALTQFSTVDEVKAAVGGVRIVALEKTSVVHWRIGEPSGRQVVLEIVGGVPHFYENEVGVLTNAPGFEWQLTNLNNYVNLYPGDAPVRRLDGGRADCPSPKGEMKEKRLHRLPLFVKFMFPPEGEGFRPQSIFDLKMLPESSEARFRRYSPFLRCRRNSLAAHSSGFRRETCGPEHGVLAGRYFQ